MAYKSVSVEPSQTQLSKGALALAQSLPFGGLSAKDKRIVASAVYKAMVGQPHCDTRAPG